MASEQIISMLEISQSGVTLVTGEFFNTRLNVIKVDKGRVFGLEDSYVVNRGAVSDSIKKVVDNASKQLGVLVQNIILLIPSFAVKRVSKKITVQVKTSDRRITNKEVNKAIKEATSGPIAEHLELINVVCDKFYVNEVLIDKSPIGEAADIMTIDFDLYYADKQLTYQYVGVCEKAGLRVIDICLDCYAAGKEMSLFELSRQQIVVAFDLHEEYTSLSLFSKGKLVSVEKLNCGYYSWVKTIVENTGIDGEAAKHLCEHNLSISDFQNDLVIWFSEENQQKEFLTQGQLNKLVHQAIINWINNLADLCAPIAQTGEVLYYLYGKSVDIAGIIGVFQETFNSRFKLYSPSTIGARDSSFVSLLGCFYAYKDQSYLADQKISSIDLTAYNRFVESSYVKSEKSFTKKIKGIFFEG